MRAAGRAVCLCAAAGLLAAVSSPRTDADDPPPILFQDLSATSGGPLDLGSPPSDILLPSCAFFDADGDGWDDFVSLTGQGHPTVYRLNRADPEGGRRFEPAPPGNGLDDGPMLERDGAALAVADVDNDGDEDLFVGAAYKTYMPAGTGRRMLLLNDGGGRFSDVAPALGLEGGDDTCAGATFFDMDLDGDLDLLACNSRYIGLDRLGDGVARLWRNTLMETGTLGFVDETSARGIAEEGNDVWAVLAFDKDGDGDQDVLVSHDFAGRTQLFENDGTGVFSEVTLSAGTGAGDDSDPSTFGDDSYAAMGIACGDPDHDGDLDLYLTNTNFRNPLYLNDGTGRFTQLASTRGASGGRSAWGCNFADFDLDGWEDLYVAGGDVFALEREDVVDFLYRNTGGAWFTDVREGSGIVQAYPLHRQHGSAVSDYDGDGRPDLLVSRAQTTGASPWFYRNLTATGDRAWLSVLLEGNGRTSNRSAIGAVVRVTPLDARGDPVPGLAQMQEVYAAESRGSRSSLRRHFGLGASAVAADVSVTWPRAGTPEERTQTFRGVPVNRRVSISEDPREATWIIDANAEAVVPDGRDSVVPVAGSGAPDPFTRIVVGESPEWVRAGSFTTGWTLAVSAPRLDAAEEYSVSLRAEPQNLQSPDSEQALRIRVVPAPRIDSIRRRGSASRIRLTGIHLEIDGLVATVGDVPCRIERVRLRRELDGSISTQMDVAVPKQARRSAPKDERVITVTDPGTGLASRIDF